MQVEKKDQEYKLSNSNDYGNKQTSPVFYNCYSVMYTSTLEHSKPLASADVRSGKLSF